MATVYLAEDPSLNRMVAIKVIHSHLSSNSNLLDRFTVEAKTAASLRNPNIVEIFDYGLEDGQQYLVMEYIDGPNLQFVLNLLGGQPMDPKVCAAVILQSAEGLSTAEKFNVVHRDIKPENMMFTSEGKLKIADFGIAHISEQNLTATGSILGSPNFMSPEQIDGSKPTHQTDMFSLGAVFYYCLSGRKPFSGPNIPTIMRNICDMPHASLGTIIPDVDPVLENLVETLLQKAPENRGKGARWLSLQLRTYLNQQGMLDPTDLSKEFLETIGKMGNQTVIDLTPAPGPDDLGSKAKAPLKPGMKFEKSKSDDGDSLEAEVKSGTGIKSGPGSKSDAAAKSKPGTWQAGAPEEDMDFGDGESQRGNARGTGSRGGPSRGKNLGLWVGAGALGFVLLVTALILAMRHGGGGQSGAGNASEPSAPRNVSVTAIALQPGSMELHSGEKRKFLVDVKPPEATVSIRWESADPSIASVQDGEVWGQKPGQTSVKAIVVGNETKVSAADIIVSPASGPAANGGSSGAAAASAAAGASAEGLQGKSAGGNPTTEKHSPTNGDGMTAENNGAVQSAQKTPSSHDGKPAPGAATGVENAATGNSGKGPGTGNDKPTGGTSAKAVLTVTSAPPFAEVIVDGRFIGTTPVKDKELSVGRHKVEVTHRSFPTIDTVVNLAPGEKTLRFRLFR